MRNESQLKVGLAAIVFTSLIAYHFTNVFSPDSADWLTIYRFSQLLVISLFVGYTVWSSIVPRLLPTEAFISGEYRGAAQCISVKTPETVLFERKLLFTINQSLFECTIDGSSKLPGSDEIYSLWFGRRFKCQGDAHYFVLEFDMPENSEYGIVKLRITNGTVDGIFWSADPNSSNKWTIRAGKCR
ncbi:MAG: hypothetical protein D3906_14175 [Candidatus Electrothrix sp. AUS1_2]|nr:hypothetical protein [Candidatus Electrothrix sp. AUS1_2]